MPEPVIRYFVTLVSVMFVPNGQLLILKGLAHDSVARYTACAEQIQHSTLELFWTTHLGCPTRQIFDV